MATEQSQQTRQQTWQTHGIAVAGGLVVKRFRHARRDEPGREWRALTLLAEHAPGLAPAPVAADPDGDPPTVTMTRLPGTPMRDGAVTGRRVAALARALTELQAAVPAPVLGGVEPRIGHPEEMIADVRAMHGEGARAGEAADPVVRAALDGLGAWLSAPESDALAAAPWDPVLSTGDGNLANFLWDAAEERVRIVDFENGGRSDRVFELAEMTEHAAAWLGAELDVDGFLASFPLDAGARERLRGFRVLHAGWWLLTFSRRGAGDSHGNPPDTAVRQADRLMLLLP